MTVSDLSSHAWLMLAVIYADCTRAATLRDIISAGDYINHGILSYEEVRLGLDRLLSCGMVKKARQGYEATEKVLGPYRKFTSKNRPVYKEMQFIEEFLRTAGPCSRSPRTALELTAEEYEKAVKEYIEGFWRGGARKK